MTAESYKLLHPAKYYKDYVDHNIRPDGRELNKYRPIIVNLGSISTADGSALAKIGKTTVICGIKAELCKPKAETPNEGFIIPNVELPPLCSPKFKSGPPTEQAQVATKIMDDFIRNSKCVQLTDLCLFNDKLVWCLFVDLICLDYDGALIDCCSIALIAALKSVLLPQVEYDPALDTKQVNLGNKSGLKVHNTPISTTFALFEGKILMDPTNEEEELSTSFLTVLVKGNELCYVIKPGGALITDDQLFECIEMSKSRAVLVEDLIRTALKSQ